MALPKISLPSYTTTLPLSKTKISYRPYTVGDEKILLSAAAARTDDPQFYIDNTLRVIRNCITEENGMLERMSSVDVEYLLLQIRAKSVGEVIETAIEDPENAKKKLKVKIALEDFKVTHNEEHEYKIELTEEVGLKMKDLTFADKIAYGTRYNDKNKTDMIFDIVVDCVESIYDKDRIYVVGTDCTKEEVREFINGISGNSHKLYKFITTMPQLSIELILPNGKTRTLSGADVDFLALSPAT